MTARCAFLSGALAAIAVTATAAVPGRVVSAEGKPVAGAVVSAYALETTEARRSRLVAGQERRALATAKSGADGSFRLEAGDAVVVVGVRAEGFAPSMTTTTGGPGDRLTVKLAPAATRRGTVTAGGRPVAGAVVVWMANGEDPQAAEIIVRTAKDGAYEVPDPDPWAASLAVVHPDYALLVATPDPKWSVSHELAGGVPIRGRVIDEKSGRGVVGAAVWLDGWPRAVSAADGSFTIAHASPGGKRITARAEGLVGGLDVAAGPLTVVARPARRLSGGVRDAQSKEPLSGALVTVMDAQYQTVASVVTDARGRYEVPSLTPGRYRVYASRTGYGSDDAGPSDLVDLRKDLARRQDVELAPLRRVTGRVVDEQGQGVEGVRVSLDWPGMGTLYGDDDSGAGQIHMVTGEADSLTGADGGFSMYLTEGFDKDSSAYASMGLLALKRDYAAGRAPLPAALDAPVSITLPRGLTVKGRVTAADGTPLGDVGVSVAESGPMLTFRSFGHVADMAGAGNWVRTDADGRYALHLHPVVHQISFHKPGHAPRVIDSFDPRSGQDLDVVLGPAAAIAGRVVRPDGRGVAGAAVTLQLQDAQQMAAGATSTDADGSFSIPDLAPGRYEMQVAKLEAGVQVTRTVEAPASDVRVEIGPAVTVHGRVFDAATRAPVSRFTIAIADTPENAFHGQLAGGQQQEYNAADGTFVLEDFPVGGSTLTVSAEGYRPKAVEGVAASADAGSTALEVALEPGVSVRGRVTDTAGEALPDVRISGGVPSDDTEGATTDENGDYALNGLAPGEVNLKFEGEGFRSARRTVQATTQTTRLDVTLSRGISLAGVVLYEDAGVPRANVTASSSVTDADSQQATTDAQGRFTLQGLGPGRYSVTAFADRKGKAEVHDVDSATGGPLRLVIERVPTAILSGTVVGLEEPSGRAPTMVMVQVEGTEGRSAHSFVQMSGAFRIEDAPTGPVTVTAHAMTPGGNQRTSQPRELTLAAGSDNTIVLEFRDDLVVTGTVTSGGVPASNIAVSFRSAEDSDASSSTDREGRYEVRLAPGPYQVRVSGQEIDYETSYVAVDSGSFDIDVTGGTLRGRAVDAGSGTPVAGVDVSLWREGSDKSPVTSLETSAQGTFEAPLVREGRYRVVTARKGFGQAVREVEVSRGETTEVLLELQPAEGVSVKVTDARDGRPLSAYVVVRDRAKRVVSNQHAGTDNDGAVVIPLADGAYLLSTSASGYGTTTVPVTAPSKGLEVGLTPGGSLVIDSARTLRGRIRLVQPDGEEYVRCWCNGIADITLSGRRTRVENVTPGRYTVEFVDASDVTPPPPVVIREGEVTTVTIE